MKMEEFALENESDEASRERLAALRADLADREEELRALEARWEQEKSSLEGEGELRRSLDQLRIEAERQLREGNLEAASKINYESIPELEQQDPGGGRRGEVRPSSRWSARRSAPEQIAEVVEAWTGIPTGRMLEGETAKLLRMEDVIGERLIGQADAVRAVSDAVRRSRAGISDPNRPTGSFLFLGPTGVGKTELARSLADFLFDDDRAMVRIDMSEYSEKHSVARLVGAPPGYVGYDEGGQLTEAVRRRPYSVVLLDEVEKAHPEVFDILLQVLDDGRLTDGQGRTVDFRNTLLILTSNLGSHVPGRPDAGPGQEEGVGAVGRPVQLQAGVPQPARRDRASSTRCPRTTSPTSSTSSSGCSRSGSRCAGSRSRSPTPRGPGSPRPATTRRTAPARCAG